MNQDKDREIVDKLCELCEASYNRGSTVRLRQWIYETLRSVRTEAWNEAIEKAAEIASTVPSKLKTQNWATEIRSLKKQSGGEEK